jgi:hypothetical protein
LGIPETTVLDTASVASLRCGTDNSLTLFLDFN